MNLKGKKILVVGLGKTGEEVCRFLLPRGAQVKVSEKKTGEELGGRLSFLEKKGVKVETGTHQLSTFLENDLIVPSPGVPPLPELKAAQEQGVKIISEIEMAYSFLKGKIVGITGSNGKSTTASLTHKILKEGGLPSYLAGNIGTPLISLVENSQKDDIYVAEISSFQLQYTQHFRSAVSVLLNISPDHLDWHPSFTQYFEAKKKLLDFQQDHDKAVLNRDQPLVWKLRSRAKAQVYGFSRKVSVCPGCFVKGEWIVIRDKQQGTLMKTSEIPLVGSHNQENVMAAAAVGYLFGIPLSQIKKSVKTFIGLQHRLEKVSTIAGVDFFNDSKATNVEAALNAVQSFSEKIILILGGRDKGGDFKKLRLPVKEKAKKIIVLGEAAGKIERALQNSLPVNRVSSLREAVRMGFRESRPGEVVLLAPACTSFDMFQNFEQRGDIFKQEVFDLKKEVGKRKAE
ncbi:MAG: UDP-N-acetylmuramoyl-L-alanine--D-glutamate ligase [Candidatus Aminicenantes bacterium]